MPELRCPTCNKLFEPRESEAMPFCSARCKQIDLAAWLDEEYGIPVEPEDHQDRRNDAVRPEDD